MSEMWCNNYIKVPFKDHGRDENGCDCWGLVRLIYKKELAIDLPEFLEYKDIKDGVNIAEMYKEEHLKWETLELGDEKEFDVLVFKILGLPTHIAIVIKKGLMLHCEKGIGTHVSDYYREKQWRDRLKGVYRYAKR